MLETLLKYINGFINVFGETTVSFTTIKVHPLGGEGAYICEGDEVIWDFNFQGKRFS
jgi:hypothetical protein